MRPGSIKTVLGASLMALGVLLVVEGPRAGFGDEPGRLGRLFRFGSGGSNPSVPPPSPPAPGAPAPGDQSSPLLFSAGASNSAGAARILPQPRVSRPATESDPILSRISLVRSSEGNQFGMVMQVYADGTVIDNEGVHHLSSADMKPLMDVLQSPDLYRLKGHCGAPATDFVEQVYLVVYERRLGSLRANAFSYSGNPQGCDHAVQHLHRALEGIQAKLSRNAPPVAAGAGATGSPAYSAPPVPSGPSIGLSTTP